MNKYFKTGDFNSSYGARVYVNTYTDDGKFISGNVALDNWSGATLISEEEYNALGTNYILFDGAYFTEAGKALRDAEDAQEKAAQEQFDQERQAALQVALERKVDLAVKILSKFLEQNLFAKEDLPMILAFFNVPREVITPTMERLDADQS